MNFSFIEENISLDEKCQKLKNLLHNGGNLYKLLDLCGQKKISRKNRITVFKIFKKLNWSLENLRRNKIDMEMLEDLNEYGEVYISSMDLLTIKRPPANNEESVIEIMNVLGRWSVYGSEFLAQKLQQEKRYIENFYLLLYCHNQHKNLSCLRNFFDNLSSTILSCSEPECTSENDLFVLFIKNFFTNLGNEGIKMFQNILIYFEDLMFNEQLCQDLKELATEHRRYYEIVPQHQDDMVLSKNEESLISFLHNSIPTLKLILLRKIHRREIIIDREIIRKVPKMLLKFPSFECETKIRKK